MRARNEVDLRVVVLAERAVRIGAGGVEIAQPDRADAVGPLEMRQRPLDRQLGLAVGVDRPLRMRFVDRRLAARRKVAHVDEKMNGVTPLAAIASSTASAPPTLFS